MASAGRYGTLKGNHFQHVQNLTVTQCTRVQGLGFLSFVGSLVFWSVGKTNNSII